MGADIAARTKRIRIGFAALIIPFWNPIRLAEDVALLDQLCDGRLEVGVGRGNYPVEALNLNAPADPRNQEGNYKVFEETLEIMKRALSQRYFSFEGETYEYPAKGCTWDRPTSGDSSEFMNPETKEFTKLSIMPRPIQTPHPPLWQVVDSPKSIEFSARNDLKFIMWRPTAKSLAAHYRHYAETARAAGKTQPAAPGPSILRDTFIAGSMAEARDIAGEHVMRHLNFSNWRGPHIYTNPGEVLPPEQEAALRKGLTYDWVHERSLLFGDPAFVVDKLQELRDVANIDNVIISCSWGELDPELSRKSTRLFAEKVLPKFA